jgi:hypothetical protein
VVDQIAFPLEQNMQAPISAAYWALSSAAFNSVSEMIGYSFALWAIWVLCPDFGQVTPKFPGTNP